MKKHSLWIALFFAFPPLGSRSFLPSATGLPGGAEPRAEWAFEAGSAPLTIEGCLIQYNVPQDLVYCLQNDCPSPCQVWTHIDLSGKRTSVCLQCDGANPVCRGKVVRTPADGDLLCSNGTCTGTCMATTNHLGVKSCVCA